MFVLDLIFGIILYFSSFDRQLSTRTEHKTLAASQSSNVSQFIQIMSNSHENGTNFACGLTRSWVSELFEGLDGQFEEFKSAKKNFGYKNFTGSELLSMFSENFNTTNGWIYNMRHMGSQDHDWVIQQLPNGEGYRIFQSYHDAYSLKAWLSPSSEGLFEKQEIILPHDLKKATDDSLKKLSNGALNLSNFETMRDYWPQEIKNIAPYINYVIRVNESMVVDMFETARQKWGGGRVLNQSEFFGDYLYKQAKLMDYFAKNDGTENVFPNEIYQMWIDLYGSPDPIYYPGLPNNFLSKNIAPGPYYFETKVISLSSNITLVKQNVVNNGKVLQKALEK